MIREWLMQRMNHHGLIISTMLLFGWLEGLLVEMIRVTGRPVGVGTASLLAALAVSFAGGGMLVERFRLTAHWQHLRPLSLAWATLCLGLGWAFSFEAVWTCFAVIGVIPLLAQWLTRVPQADRRGRTFVASWIGMTGVAGALVALSTWTRFDTHLIFTLALIPLLAAAWVLCDVPPVPRSGLGALKPTRVTVGALGLFLVLGLGSEEISHWLAGTVLTRWPLNVPLALASFLVMAAVPLAFRQNRQILAYFSAIFLTGALLGCFDRATPALVVGLEAVTMVAANLLILWRAVSLIANLGRKPLHLGLALGATALATAVGWWLPSLTPGHAVWVLVAVMLVVIVTPLITPTVVTPMGGEAAQYRGDPEPLFEQAKLTPQERRIVHLLLEGKNNQAIIAELYVSINTLKTHLKNIYRKTETKNRQELIDRIGHPQRRSSGQ